MKPFKHQEKALNETEHFNRVAYFLDMGLGKTFVGSEKMLQLNKRLNLIVCQKSKIQDWRDHMIMNYAMNHSWIVYDLTIKNELEMFIRATSSGYDGNIVGIINYELAWRRPDLINLEDFTLLLDESSLIQNRKAKQSKFILKMNPTNVILLSGTPTAGKYENLWTQIHLLGWNITEALYHDHYVNFKLIDAGGMIVKTIDKDDPYKNVDRLKKKLRSNGAIFMKTEEVMDLPDQTFIDIRITTSKEYRKFMKQGIITIGDKTLIGDMTLTKRLYARQLCGHFNQDKLNAFSDLLGSTNDRMIVFYNYNDELAELEKIAKELDRPISKINGKIKDLTAYESEINSVTLVQYQAGAMGLNLQKANKIIYFTLPERSELFEQSKKRIHRIGQDRPCFYYIMKCQGSVEDLIHETLKMRKDFTDELFEQVERG